MEFSWKGSLEAVVEDFFCTESVLPTKISRIDEPANVLKFSDCGADENIEIFFFRDGYTKSDEDYVSMMFALTFPYCAPRRYTFSCDMSIKDIDGNRRFPQSFIYRKKVRKYPLQKRNGRTELFGFNQFVKREYILQHRSELLHDRALIFEIHTTVIKETSLKHYSTYKSTEVQTYLERKLFEEPKNSRLFFTAKEFQNLCEVSPYFQRFQRKCCDKFSNVPLSKLHYPIDEDEMWELLQIIQFIKYETFSVKMNFENCYRLYCRVRKYEITDLSEILSEHLKMEITPYHAGKILDITNTYEDSSLRDCAEQCFRNLFSDDSIQFHDHLRRSVIGDKSFKLQFSSEDYKTLCKVSPVIKDLESVEPSKQYLEIDADDAWAFRNMVAFLTTRAINVECFDDILELYITSIQYKVWELWAICLKAILKNTIPETVEEFYEFAEQLGDELLKAAIDKRSCKVEADLRIAYDASISIYKLMGFDEKLRKKVMCQKRFKLYCNSKEYRKLCQVSPLFEISEDIQTSEEYLVISAQECWMFRNMLSFVTSRTVGIESFVDIVELYEISDKYQVLPLFEICSKIMINNITACFVDLLTSAANKTKDDNLKDALETFKMRENQLIQDKITMLKEAASTDEKEFFTRFGLWNLLK